MAASACLSMVLSVGAKLKKTSLGEIFCTNLAAEACVIVDVGPRRFFLSDVEVFGSPRCGVWIKEEIELLGALEELLILIVVEHLNARDVHDGAKIEDDTERARLGALEVVARRCVVAIEQCRAVGWLVRCDRAALIPFRSSRQHGWATRPALQHRARRRRALH